MSRRRNRRKKKKQQQQQQEQYQLRNFKVVRDVDVLVIGQSFEGCRVADAVEPAPPQKLEEGDSYGFEGDPFARHRGHFPITRYV